MLIAIVHMRMHARLEVGVMYHTRYNRHNFYASLMCQFSPGFFFPMHNLSLLQEIMESLLGLFVSKTLFLLLAV